MTQIETIHPEEWLIGAVLRDFSFLLEKEKTINISILIIIIDKI